MLFDYHVHVTGAILRSYKRDLIENKLKDSLDESGVNGFLGIVASGSLFSQPVYNNLEDTTMYSLDCFSKDLGLLEDTDCEGLNIVKRLGGTPALMIYPYILKHEDHVSELLKRIKDEGIKAIKLYQNYEADVSSLEKAADYGVTTLLVHTPTNIKFLKPVFSLASGTDLQLILGHGCYDDKELMKQVKDYGFNVDTSVNPLSSIKKWISYGLEKQLLFGSDWPSGPGTSLEFDWNAQKREFNKLGKIKKIIIKNKVRI